MQRFVQYLAGPAAELAFTPVQAELFAAPGGQSNAWGDFDIDGDLDLALAANDPAGSHFLCRNDLPDVLAGRSIQVLVLDGNGHYTRAGSEVRVCRAGTSDLLGLGLVDTGSGYHAQNAMPVHVGLPDMGRVDVDVTTMYGEGRVSHRFAHVDPAALAGKPCVAKTGRA